MSPARVRETPRAGVPRNAIRTATSRGGCRDILGGVGSSRTNTVVTRLVEMLCLEDFEGAARKRVRFRSPRVGRRVAAIAAGRALWADLRCAVWDCADGHQRAVGLSRRPRARAGGGSDKRPDGDERVIADPDGGRGEGMSGLLVPGLSAGRCTAHHGADRARRPRRIRRPGDHRR